MIWGEWEGKSVLRAAAGGQGGYESSHKKYKEDYGISAKISSSAIEERIGSLEEFFMKE